MFAGRRFHFRPILTICAFAGLAVLLSLGTWQLKRLDWKRGLIAKVEARTSAEPIPLDKAIERFIAGEDMEYAPVRTAGVFQHDKEAHVFGTLEGVAGYYIFTPILRVETVQPYAATIYVNRGFAPQELKEAQARRDGLTEGPVIIEGLFRTAEAGSGLAAWFRPEDALDSNQWFQRNPELFASAAGIGAPSYYIDSFAVEGFEWPKGGTTRVDFNNRHLEYALTWFGLAATLLGVWLSFSLQKPSETNNFKK